MKKTISILLVLVLVLGLSACSKSMSAQKVVTQANENIAACSQYLESLPLVLDGAFDGSTMTYTLTLAISSAEEYKDYIYKLHYQNLVANGFNSLSSAQKEAVIAQLMAESDKCGNAEKAILALAIKELPMENFEELGIKLEIVYKNRNGVKTVIDKNTIPAA